MKKIIFLLTIVFLLITSARVSIAACTGSLTCCVDYQSSCNACSSGPAQNPDGSCRCGSSSSCTSTSSRTCGPATGAPGETGTGNCAANVEGCVGPVSGACRDVDTCGDRICSDPNGTCCTDCPQSLACDSDPNNDPPAGSSCAWCTLQYECWPGWGWSGGDGYCSDVGGDRKCCIDPNNGYTGPGCNWYGSGCKANQEWRTQPGDRCCSGDLVPRGTGSNGMCACSVCGDGYCDTDPNFNDPATCPDDCCAEGAPPVPTFTSPSNGMSIFNAAQNGAPISWSRNNQAYWTGIPDPDYWEVQIYPEGTSCSDPDAQCFTTTSPSYYYNPTGGLTYSGRYQVRIRGFNTCRNDATGAWSAWQYFHIVDSVSGIVHLVSNGNASFTGDVCTLSGSSAGFDLPGASITGLQGTFSNVHSINGDGTYLVYVPRNILGSQVSLTGYNPESYHSMCPNGGSYGGMTPPRTGINFYVVESRDPWFQQVGGRIAAFSTSGAAIYNPISDLCSGTCEPYMITQLSGANTSGDIVTGGGTVDTSVTSGVQTTNLNEDQNNRLARMEPKATRETYDYFKRLYKFPADDLVQDDFGSNAPNAGRPTAAPANAGVNAYFRNGDLIVGQNWDVANGESYTVFVDGNLRIENNASIQVAEGGFLAFIVSGNITFGSDVGYSDLTQTASQVEGMFVADGQIITESRGTTGGGDLKFVGAGTFVGWSGVSLSRDFDDGGSRRAENNDTPVELFYYRPDFALNAPEEMLTPLYNWQEVAP